jgi:hypothetical protein
MNRILFLSKLFLFLITATACVTTHNNISNKEQSKATPEICEINQIKPKPYPYIWLIDKELPLPKVIEIRTGTRNEAKNTTNDLAKSVKAPVEVDPIGLPIPKPPAKIKIKTNEIKKAESSKAKTIETINDDLKVKKSFPKEEKSPTPLHENTELANKKETEATLYTKEIKSEIQPVKKRNIYARQGDDIEIVFNNPGWIFLGYALDEDENGLKYISKSSKDEKTLFRFKALQFGNYNLNFQMQNNISGNTENELIIVKVVMEDEFSSFLQNNNSSNDTILKDRDFSFANKLFELGQYQHALNEYLKLYQEGDFFLNQRLACIYFNLNDYRKAIYYWKKNLSADPDYFKNAIEGLSSAYIKIDDYNALVSHLKYLFTYDNVSSENELLILAKYFASRNNDKLALDLLNEYQKSYPYGKYTAEVYYLLATLYEKNTDFRNLKESRNYYQKIITEYPESLFADASLERVNYLNQHFFYVR